MILKLPKFQLTHFRRKEGEYNEFNLNDHATSNNNTIFEFVMMFILTEIFWYQFSDCISCDLKLTFLIKIFIKPSIGC